ncbi:GH92 family glycosyl hydrolase [Arcticibacter tournemirensis]|uniref:Glycoside hydrolase family 92 protein n=1 Tax=Arcticibacter tournemirensis TaxID=699437 RepID=A0A4Q0M953_9SPHI|nr:GH92 family glycosyl hydrolase [Arcticibacter tournemirensis]RXF69664.1 glycoside hydrolase family 92 protein [Arcticibacter tournemirensis]
MIVKKALGLLTFISYFSIAPAQQVQRKVDFVNPFIGTGAAAGLPGCAFPGPTVPFGMVQLSPDTKEEIDARPCSGYDYKASTIVGFSHTHLNGTGIPDLVDVLMMPTTGEIKTDAGTEDKPGSGYRSRFSHEQESAKPGYYSVQLLDYDIKAELAATMHAGFHRYTFPEGKPWNLVIDMDHSSKKGTKVRSARIIAAQIRVVDNQTIEGYRVMSGWAKLRKVYFYARFSRPFNSTLMQEGKFTYPNKMLTTGNTDIKAAVTFDQTGGREILVKVGISAISTDNAKENLDTEIKDWNFDRIVAQTEDLWEKELSKMDIEGTTEQKQIFYTCMYHAFTQPNNITDVNGDYTAGDMTIRNAGKKEIYSTFSLWDTYRAAHPLYTLIQIEKTAGFVNSMVLHHKSYGFLPIWELWGSETYCMIGNHAIPVIADAIMKDLPGIDVDEAYKAVKETSMTDHVQSPISIWEKYGYMPEDLQSQSVSITLETAYNDWCVAQLAKKLNHMDDYAYFMKRAGFYKNLYDAKTVFFRAKNSDGKWLEPFNALEYGHNGGHPFTEANAWQYLWYVPHQVKELVHLMGNEKKFGDRLDRFFTYTDTSTKVNHNASGFIGQYAHGNEPSHHVAYLYNFSDRQWKAQFYISKILNEMYSATPQCYIGNNDCGQMSAWYIFSAMGFYPVNPANSIYNIGSPVLKSATIRLDNGRSFTVKTTNVSKANCYIQSMRLNNKPYNKSYITQADIVNGGTLEFVMGNKPSAKKLINYTEPN